MARVAINTGAVANDGTGDTLRAAGGIINSNFTEIYTYLGSGSTTVLGAPMWKSTNAGIHTTLNVGIGTTNPRFTLEVGAVGASGTTLYVNGDARITGIVTIGTSSITLNGSTNRITVGSGVTIDGSTGIISATSVVLGGTTITGAGVTYITAGSGISVNQNTGNVTITATGGGGGGESYWASTTAGIHTTSNVGVGTTNPTSALTVKGNTSLETLNVSGVSTFANTIEVGTGKSLTFGSAAANYLKLYSDGSNTYINQSNVGKLIIDASGTQRTLEITDSQASQTMAKFIGNSGPVELYHSGSKKFETLGAGVTVTGTTFTNQLSVSGVSTFIDDLVLYDSYGIALVWDSSQSRLEFASGKVVTFGDSVAPQLEIYNLTNQENSIVASGGVPLSIKTSANASTLGNATTKLSISGAGITVTGTTSTDQLNVTGVSTLGTVQISSGIITASSGINTFYGDVSNAADGRWTLGANGTSDYTFTGVGFTQTTNDPVLYLARGRVYEFVNNSGGSHPFEIRLSNGGSAYNDGVTNNASASGTIRFVVPFNAPNTLYYQCTNHSGMGNTISVYPSTI